MALAQGTYFKDRAILANNNTELDQLYQSQLNATPSNQAAFTNYSSFPIEPAPGVKSGDWQVHYVLFNGSLENQMTAVDDLYLAYNFYCKALCLNHKMLSRLTNRREHQL